jgi:hypothetical protein
LWRGCHQAEVRGWDKIRSPWRHTRGDVPPEQAARQLSGALDAPNAWVSLNLAAIAAHLIGGAGVLYANKGRVATQRGVGASTAAKLALTGADLAVTAYSRVQGKKLQDAGMVPVQGATEPSVDTPADVAKAQRQLKVCQWAIPALTAGIAVLNVVEGEQQRPSQVVSGILAKPAQLLGIASGS